MTTNYSEVPKRTKLRTFAVSLRMDGPYELGLKRIFDILCVLLAAPFILPLIGVLALMVARDGSTPFYRQ